ncbi:MAG: response regulator [Eubacterium sp.]|nr:response regulator [Eubacterium sp.]
MKKGKIKNSKFTVRVAIIGSLVVALVLIAGTYWMGTSASSDTETAVRNVSLLYLDELAGRREQVVASTLERYMKDLDLAIGMMEKEDHSSVVKLQAYQARMKQLYSLEKFAFVDENGLIYTSKGTRDDIDSYDFDYNTLSDPEVSIKNTSSENIKVIIAMPVDRIPLGNTHLVVGFMEMSMEHLLEVVSLQSENNNTTFCNLYLSDGTTLTEKVLGGAADDNNLFSSLDPDSFDTGYSLGEMKKDFTDGNRGVVSFTYNNVRETLCYVLVHNTDWMLTYLIRESVISDQIAQISNGIILRSVIQSVATALVLFVIFGILISQTKRAANLVLEREISEQQQQEMEERIALQDELLAQEEQRAEQDSMINAMASDYKSVYYVDLDTGETICYRSDDEDETQGIQGERFNFYETFTDYAKSYVAEEYRDGFLEFIRSDNIKKALENQKIIAYRYLTIKKDGEMYEMLRMAGVGHKSGAADDKLHAVGVGFTDIDDEMRDQMAKSQALNDALKAAEEASRAKTTFLSNMSHEIRTPMNAIIGLDSLALNDPDISETTRDYLKKIGASAEHLLSLINDILDMSRIESGRMSLQNEEFEFLNLIEQINIIFGAQCEDKGLTYECNIKGGMSDYYIGDGTKLRQVLINILGNAVKFTPKGGKVTFDIEKTASFDRKTTLRFTISDTGIGMKKEYIPKLFDTFSQEDASASNKYGSSGLGMSITKSIVDMMNGEIGVESEKGKGTTFTVTVTLLESERKKSENSGDIEIRPQDMKVLVIDDDPIACDHAKLVLNREGMAVDTALSGAEAIDMIKVHDARQDSYQLYVVDLKMEGMDGVETSRLIRELIGDESAIIILTAYNYEDVLDDAREAGVDSFMSKPIMSGSLMEKFREAIRQKKLKKKENTAKASLTGRRILLAEDMEINAQIMLEILKMKEIAADHAENGRIALDMFSSRPEGYYDAILMDMRMPEMDGLQATTAIRELDREDAKQIPIIALTANAFDEDVQRSLQAGLNAHLSKPVQPDVLFETLENLL